MGDGLQAIEQESDVGLGSAWWAGLGAAARWVPDFSSAAIQDGHAGTSYHAVWIKQLTRCFQGCISNTEGQQNAGDDTGNFYAVNVWPQMLSFRVQAAAGATSIGISNSIWTHPGKIRYQVRKVSDDSVVATSGYYPSSAGTSYAPSVTLSGLSSLVAYRLMFWIDADPDIPGYTEQWWKTLVEWVQPPGGARELDRSVDYPTEIFGSQVSVNGGHRTNPASSESSLAQFVELLPTMIEGDLDPTAYYPEQSAYYRTPWVIDNPNTGATYPYPYGWQVTAWFYRRDGMWALHHRQPWAWSGTPAAVIAAIVMQAGMGSAWIDQDSIDDAYDAYSGDAPWAALYAVHGLPTVYVSRRIRQTVADLVYDVIRHTRDLLAVTMDGKLAVISRTRGPTLAGLTPADGLIDVEGEGSNTDHLFNSAYASFGHAYRSWGSCDTAPDAGSYSCAEERQLESYRGEKWSLSQADANSQLKFGTVDLPGQEVTLQISGQPKTVVRAHYPFYLNAAWGGAILTGYAAVDALPRRIVRAVQTFLGLDYGPGAKVTNVAITGDGATIGTMYCIEKTLDFDLLRVESELIEEPTP
ncbi:MAG: hypothetical protein LLG08_00425 [Actinomycetia bacterium]|nr:hypothetical protein [Actinomycetes bacterium]